MTVEEFAKKLALAFERKALDLQSQVKNGDVDGFKSLIVAAQCKAMADARDCVLEAAGIVRNRSDNIIKFPGNDRP